MAWWLAAAGDYMRSSEPRFSLKVLHVVGAYPTARSPDSCVRKAIGPATAQLIPGFITRQIDSLEDQGVNADVCIFEGRGWKKYWRGCSKMRRMLADQDYDLVHAHFGYVGWVARMQLRAPLIVSFMGSDVVGSFRRSGLAGWFESAVHRLSTLLLSAVCEGSIVKAPHLARWIFRRKCWVVSNGIDMNLFRPMDRDECLRQLGLSQDAKYVAFSCSARLGKPVKRLSLAQSAVGLLRDEIPQAVLLVLSGLGAADVVRHLNAADVLLLTSRAEGSPNIVKEALACNLPIVSVDVGDVAERLQGVTESYIVDPDPGAIARALLSVLRTGKRSNGRERIADLALPVVAQRVANIYREVLKRSNRASQRRADLNRRSAPAASERAKGGRLQQ